MVAQVSKEFGVLPTFAAEALLDDEAGLILDSMMLLSYSRAKSALDSAKDEKELEPWKGSKMMDEAKANLFRKHKERMAARAR